MLTNIDIQPYLRKLAEQIANEVDDIRIIEAFRIVPRHHFVMQGFHAYDKETRQRKHYTPENMDAETWLKMVYQNQALTTQLHETGSPSSSSEPVLMAVMLEKLDIQAGMHVLEIGTGTGYNAALLAHLVGKSCRVDSIDNQAQLTERAAVILQDRVNVHLYTGNGLLGLPEHAPYDRIIATAGYPKVPDSLIEQLAMDGKLIMNIGSAGA